MKTLYFWKGKNLPPGYKAHFNTTCIAKKRLWTSFDLWRCNVK